MFPPYSTFCWRSERRERNHSQFMTSDISDMSVLSNIILSLSIHSYDSVYSKMRIVPFSHGSNCWGGGVTGYQFNWLSERSEAKLHSIDVNCNLRYVSV